MPIIDAPTVEQNLRRTIGDVIAIFVWNECQIRRRADKHSTKTTRQPGRECQLVSESFLLVEDSIAVGVFQNLNPADRIIGMLPSSLVIEVFSNPDPTSIVKAERDRLCDVRLGREHRNFEAVGNRHLRNGFGWF